MILDSGNQSFDQQKTKRELTGGRLIYFCNRLYCHAKELCRTEADRDSLKKIGKNQLLSFKLILENRKILCFAHGYQLIDGQSDEYPGASIQCAVFKRHREIFCYAKNSAAESTNKLNLPMRLFLEHINLGAELTALPDRIFTSFRSAR